MDNKELYLRIEAVANEKRISQDEVFSALEEALSLATEKKTKHKIRININKDSGEFETYRRYLVVADGTDFVEEDIAFNTEIHIEQKDSNGLEIDDFVEHKIDSIELGRIAAQVVKQVIIQKVKEAERDRIITEYKERIGETIQATVKRIERNNIYINLGAIDGIIPKSEAIPNELVHKGDRIKVLIKNIKPLASGVQIILSRADNELLTSLFAMEVPEIAEGIIEIKAVARDPGLRAKVAIRSKDKRLDPIGSCIGMRGSRVQAVSENINGERIDVILWDEDIVQFVINAMAPATVVSIDIDEDNNTTEIAVEDDQLAQAIGTRGQNIRLASEITGLKISVMSQTESLEKQQQAEEKIEVELAKNLDIEANIAISLVNAGFNTIDEIVDANEQDLLAIDGFDNDMVDAIKTRADDESLARALSESDSADELLAIDGVDNDMANSLIASDINTQEDLAELSIDELIDIYTMNREEASIIILAARAPWFE